MLYFWNSENAALFQESLKDSWIDILLEPSLSFGQVSYFISTTLKIGKKEVVSEDILFLSLPDLFINPKHW